jgi:hypothetical protein
MERMEVTGSMFRNEMQCLSNAVLQACIRQDLFKVWNIVPAVRKLVIDSGVIVQTVARVELYPSTLRVVLENGEYFDQAFQGLGLTPDRQSCTLYDRNRDGKVEYLHLLH